MAIWYKIDFGMLGIPGLGSKISYSNLEIQLFYQKVKHYSTLFILAWSHLRATNSRSSTEKRASCRERRGAYPVVNVENVEDTLK